MRRRDGAPIDLPPPDCCRTTPHNEWRRVSLEVDQDEQQLLLRRRPQAAAADAGSALQIPARLRLAADILAAGGFGEGGQLSLELCED